MHTCAQILWELSRCLRDIRLCRSLRHNVFNLDLQPIHNISRHIVGWILICNPFTTDNDCCKSASMVLVILFCNPFTTTGTGLQNSLVVFLIQIYNPFKTLHSLIFSTMSKITFYGAKLRKILELSKKKAIKKEPPQQKMVLALFDDLTTDNSLLWMGHKSWVQNYNFFLEPPNFWAKILVFSLEKVNYLFKLPEWGGKDTFKVGSRMI